MALAQVDRMVILKEWQLLHPEVSTAEIGVLSLDPCDRVNLGRFRRALGGLLIAHRGRIGIELLWNGLHMAVLVGIAQDISRRLARHIALARALHLIEAKLGAIDISAVQILDG